ncbi:NADH-quinone oxidoreductase subunit K [Buchnera aphidicola (Cinara kochiana kochiana)]|uniref:NADH-quinone oxidoreductase subunit K n=1 Tax=Buchnera aphidicola (Cinara kochiana kochiana) TaxID=2518976 RepID=A0A451D5A7_9GAMM|nr:NADH-quinone oxidoreductase subunit NuoK [Buchnera aphidicola]VFP81031.1 NADH-quinone oxidoreductase subunit K [Buchnera aphidicola (Cinara kochiana kochiana)]
MLLLNHGIIVSIIIFIIGLMSLLRNKNLIFTLISLEILTNAIALAIVLVGHYWNQTDGQIMYVFIITTAAAEVSIMLAFFLKIYKQYNTLDIFQLSEIDK